jgi:hypothetical protein
VWVLTAPPAGQIRLVDPHATSSTLVGNLATLEEDIPWVGALGIDPVEHAMSWVAYARVLYAHKGPLKRVLMDSTVVAGIGPLYADEILFEAGLRFDRETTSLNEQELRRLYRATVEILHDAIKHRGTSLPRRPFATSPASPAGSPTCSRSTAGRASSAPVRAARSPRPSSRASTPGTANRARSDRVMAYPRGQWAIRRCRSASCVPSARSGKVGSALATVAVDGPRIFLPNILLDRSDPVD